MAAITDSLQWTGANIRSTKVPECFYEVHPKRLATFSTKGGAIEKRPNPYPPPPPIARSDLDTDIRRKAASLRKEFPNIVRGINKPIAAWYDLHNYFDAVDLWQEGAAFLFYVLNHIANENKVLDKDLEVNKIEEIREWARMWVDGNKKRVLSCPPSEDLTTIFEQCELDCIQGLEPRQNLQLKTALDDFRKRLRVQLEEEKNKSYTDYQYMQQMQQRHHPDPSINSFPPHIQNGFPIPTGMPIMQQAPTTGGRVYSIPVDDPRRNQMMMSPMQRSNMLTGQQAIPPPILRHVPFDKLMTHRGQISNHLPSAEQGGFRQDPAPQWDKPRAHGSTSEMGRSGRGRGSVNNFSNQNRSNHHSNDRRVTVDNGTPRGSPHRRASHNQGRRDQVHVPGSQRQSSLFDGDTTPRTSSHTFMQSSQRMVSEPWNSRTGYSNDARLWLDPSPVVPADRQHTDSRPSEMANPYEFQPPFVGNPNAVLATEKATPSCTFWYEGDLRGTGYAEQGTRTVYVSNFHRMAFETHELRDLFEQFGTVESITFLYKLTPQAFVAFSRGFEGSVIVAIEELHGYVMPSGHRLIVNAPRNRQRSDSQASDYSAYTTRNRSNSTNPREPSHRVGYNNHRGSTRHHSLSCRPNNSSNGDHYHNPPHPSERSSPTPTPLKEGFQAQLQPAEQLPIQHVADRLSSSMAEVIQHQAALNRYPRPNPMPLGNIENRTHSRGLSISGIQQPHTVMSQGSHSRKENSPMQKTWSKNTPSTSPKKEFSQYHGTENQQKNHLSKNKKKGKQQAWSNYQSCSSSPAENNFDDMVVTALATERKLQSEASLAQAQKEATLLDNISPADIPKAISSVDLATLDNLEVGTLSVDVPQIAAPKIDNDVVDNPGISSPNAKTSEINTPKLGSPNVATPKTATPKPNSKPGSTSLLKKSGSQDAFLSTGTSDGQFESFSKAESVKSGISNSNETAIGGINTDSYNPNTKAKFLGLEELSAETNVAIHISDTSSYEVNAITEPYLVKTPRVGVSNDDTNNLAAHQELSVDTSNSPAVSLIDSGEVIAELELESKSRKKNKKKQQKKRKERASKGDADQSIVSLNSNGSSETLKSSFMTEHSEQFYTARSSPNPSLTSGPSDPFLYTPDTAIVSPDNEAAMSTAQEIMHWDANDHHKTESIATNGSPPKSIIKSDKKSLKEHLKTASDASVISKGSVRKADMKPKKIVEKNNENLKFGESGSPKIQKGNGLSAPAVDINDSLHWPTLGPVKTSSVIEAKVSAVPIPQPPIERKKNLTAPIVPAVPLNMPQQRRRPSIDSRAWPIVKRCKMK